ncbi:hypothetical protein ES703_79051 [subsurface metagenome]
MQGLHPLSQLFHEVTEEVPPTQAPRKPPGPDTFIALPRYPLPPVPTPLDFPLTTQDLFNHLAGILESCLAPELEPAGQWPLDHKIPELLHLLNLWQPPREFPLMSLTPLRPTPGTPLPKTVDFFGKPVAIFAAADEEMARARLVERRRA